MDCAPGVLLTDAVLDGRAAAPPDDTVVEDLEPETVLRTPSVTEARGFADVEDLSAEDPASGEATDARGAGRVAGVGLVAAAAGLVVALAAVRVAVAADAGAFGAGIVAEREGGASDWRRLGTGGGGMAFDAAAADGFVAGTAPVLEAFFKVEVAEEAVLDAGATDAFAAEGVDLTVPEPNLPEAIIWERPDTWIQCKRERARWE